MRAWERADAATKIISPNRPRIIIQADSTTWSYPNEQARGKPVNKPY
jgi:hypothetical protein